MKAWLFIFISLLVVLPVQAASGCNNKGECIDTGQWRIGAAVGVGGRTNPLRGGDTQSLVLIGDVAWYSDAFYFDNFELGYQWQSEQSTTTVDAYIVLDREARPFFSYEGFDASPFELLSAEQLAAVSDEDTRKAISVDDIADRRNGGHIGLRFHIGKSQASEWQFSIEQDVANVHEGAKARIAYRYSTRWHKWLFSISPQLVWNNATFNNYYYGVDRRDTADRRLWYRAGSGFRPGMNAALSQQLSEHWGLLLFTRYQYLPDAIRNSPLVTGDDIITAFAGLTYQF